ncbi:MAG TPA: hypothetical protein VME42_20145 [Steroidobacteraceae bacterium]|nr:hypothetical protein [Steroidobacteraceae bacterium]
MFFAEAQIRVRLYGQPTDMRKSYDGLQALARHAMGHDPLDGGSAFASAIRCRRWRQKAYNLGTFMHSSWYDE